MEEEVFFTRFGRNGFVFPKFSEKQESQMSILEGN